MNRQRTILLVALVALVGAGAFAYQQKRRAEALEDQLEYAEMAIADWIAGSREIAEYGGKQIVSAVEPESH